MVGRPDEVRGEEVHAVVALVSGADIGGARGALPRAPRALQGAVELGGGRGAAQDLDREDRQEAAAGEARRGGRLRGEASGTAGREGDPDHRGGERHRPRDRRRGRARGGAGCCSADVARSRARRSAAELGEGASYRTATSPTRARCEAAVRPPSPSSAGSTAPSTAPASSARSATPAKLPPRRLEADDRRRPQRRLPLHQARAHGDGRAGLGLDPQHGLGRRPDRLAGRRPATSPPSTASSG